MGTYDNHKKSREIQQKSASILINGKSEDVVVSNNTYIGDGNFLQVEGETKNLRAFQNTQIDPSSFARGHKKTVPVVPLLNRRVFWAWVGTVFSAVLAGAILHFLGFV